MNVCGSNISVNEVQGIAFDHAKIIHYALERLRAKVEYTDIAFNLMPETFTLTSLQKVYETISGKKLLAAAFRRKNADWVIETGEYTGNAGHRPSGDTNMNIKKLCFERMERACCLTLFRSTKRVFLCFIMRCE
ncbi:hypothetical protein AMS66_28420 [Paenibacillus xylanivorans]|uniref:NrtR DNA-binding winged helix domain-containing protein n=1 Tax=Paenibacillus xylanivorans TaxID=1705561 RepID=A0A0N0UGQ8_9BACL|nr:hypothetical protein AMS66_28420 [Paenibacillus xylanivorans]